MRRLAGIGLLLVAFPAPAVAQDAVRGEILAQKHKGFGRVVLTFPVPLVASVSVAGGVAVVRFDRPVAIVPDTIAPRLPEHVTAARLDPDRRALRLALAQSLRVDLKDGAEQLFLDFLPAGWRGPPPPMPPEVAARLAQRARAAQAAAAAITQPVPAARPQAVRVALARTDGLTRLTFSLPSGAIGRTESANGRLTIAFEGAVLLDEAAIRAELAGSLDGLKFDAGSARFSFKVPEGVRVADGMDEGAFAVDLVSGPRARPGLPAVPAAKPEALEAGSGGASIDTSLPPAIKPDAPPASLVLQGDVRPPVFDADGWARDRRGSVREGWYELIDRAADAPKRERNGARMRLAAFLLANGLAAEAGAVLAAVALDDPRAAVTRPVLLMHGLALLVAERGAEASVYLNDAALANDGEATMLRAWMAFQAGQWPAAHAGFVAGMPILQAAPEALQGLLLPAAIDTALEVGDVAFAEQALAMLERLDASERDPALIPLYRGRIAAAQGQVDAALALLEKARSGTRPVEAQARLYRALFAQAHGATPAEAARAELETVAMIWRRGNVEALARVRLAEMAISEGRWRDAFAASRRAVEIQPELAKVRALQDEMGKRFEALFLETQPDGLPKIEALAIFEEFRSLIPPGPRGDDIVRRLAERLVDLDLTAQASELLTYQMEHRLKGLPRAEAGARLALLYLDDGLPKDALGALRASRYAALPPELRKVRVEIEARALGALGRVELALELLQGETGTEAEKVRAEIFWRAKRWSDAAEAYERALAPMREPGPDDRIRVLRAALGHLMAGDRLGAHRLREAFADRMKATPDGALFDALTAGSRPDAEALGAVARAPAAAGSMASFLDAYRKRFVDPSPRRPPAPT